MTEHFISRGEKIILLDNFCSCPTLEEEELPYSLLLP